MFIVTQDHLITEGVQLNRSPFHVVLPTTVWLVFVGSHSRFIQESSWSDNVSSSLKIVPVQVILTIIRSYLAI